MSKVSDIPKTQVYIAENDEIHNIQDIRLPNFSVTDEGKIPIFDSNGNFKYVKITDIEKFRTNELLNSVSIINDTLNGGTHDVVSAEVSKNIALQITDTNGDNNVTIGSYLHAQSGYTEPTIVSGYKWCYSDFIPLTSDVGTIVWKGGGYNGGSSSNNAIIALYDSNKIYYTYYGNSSQNGERTINISNSTRLAYIRASFLINDENAGIYDYSGRKIFIPTIKKGKLKELQENIENGDVKNEWSLYPLVNIVQRITDTRNWEYGNIDLTRAVTGSITLVPYDGCTLKFKVPKNMRLRLQYGNITSDTDQGNATAYGSFKDGDTYEIPKGIANIRILFYNVDYSANILVSDIYDAINENRLAVYYRNKTPNIIEKNIHCERYTKAVMYKDTEASSTSYIHNMPIIAHISDIHGDIVRLRNAFEYCKYLGVDMILNTGDTVANRAQNGSFFYNEMLPDDITTLICVGNHDIWYEGQSSVDAQLSQNYKTYRDIIEPTTTKYLCSLPTNTEYDDGITYYYKDFQDISLRVISMNVYEQGLKLWSSYGRISKKQIDWFINVLSSTPTGYGVLLMYHCPIGPVIKVENSTKFYQNFNDSIKNDNYPTSSNIDGNPICDIIDAFIDKTSANGSYTQLLYDDSTESVTWNADFTNLNSNVEFIAHLNGHTHKDFIGYYKNCSNIQLCMSITTLQSIYGFTHYYKANDSDIVRGGCGAVEDCFNIYALDRDSGNVRVARIGSNITSDLLSRDFMIIPYK